MYNQFQFASEIGSRYDVSSCKLGNIFVGNVPGCAGTFALFPPLKKIKFSCKCEFLSHLGKSIRGADFGIWFIRSPSNKE